MTKIRQIFESKFKDIEYKLLDEYLDICINLNKNEHISGVTEYHHILPVAIFPEFEDLKKYGWNGTFFEI